MAGQLNRWIYRGVVIGAFISATLVFSYRLHGLATQVTTRVRLLDFNHYYGTAWLLRERGNPYGVPFLSTALADQFEWPPYIPTATNPPLLALVTLPLASLPPATAHAIWVAVVAASGILALIIALWQFRTSWRLAELLLAALLFLSTDSFFSNLFLGQSQTIVLLAATLGWVAYRHRLSRTAAVLWGFTAALKLYGWPLLFLFLARREWRLALVGGVSALLFFLVPGALFDPVLIRDFFLTALPLVQQASTRFHETSASPVW